MQILGQRLLVSRVEEEVKEGFQTVDVVDSFIYKGKIEQIGGDEIYPSSTISQGRFNVGDIVLFAKYSPDTQEIDHDGKKMKIVSIDDILAIL